MVDFKIFCLFYEKTVSSASGSSQLSQELNENKQWKTRTIKVGIPKDGPGKTRKVNKPLKSTQAWIYQQHIFSFLAFCISNAGKKAQNPINEGMRGEPCRKHLSREYTISPGFFLLGSQLKVAAHWISNQSKMASKPRKAKITHPKFCLKFAILKGSYDNFISWA